MLLLEMQHISLGVVEDISQIFFFCPVTELFCVFKTGSQPSDSDGDSTVDDGEMKVPPLNLQVFILFPAPQKRWFLNLVFLSFMVL